jgi:drug/metabolite transporter superfamily protein YnfA
MRVSAVVAGSEIQGQYNQNSVVRLKGLLLSRAASICVLILAAGLEAGGDAIVRVGLHSASTWHRAALFAVGAVVLFAYGWTVNAPPWDFGRLLGLYVVFFFVIAQLISWSVFRQRPSLALLMGGCLIAAGGLVISLAKM